MVRECGYGNDTIDDAVKLLLQGNIKIYLLIIYWIRNELKERGVNENNMKK